MANKIRATIETDGVGAFRHELYADVLARINQSYENGYYIEAITLLESIISDRLESICNEVNQNNDDAFSMLGTLINHAKRIDVSEDWSDILNKLDEWRKKRNSAIHEMAKIEDGNMTPFVDRYATCKDIVEEGKVLFREIDNNIRKYRNK